MLTIFEEYLNVLQALHVDMNRTIEGLEKDALDWSPGPDMNSLAVLAVHVSGSERYWIGHVAGSDAAERNREAEFRVRGLGAKTLRDKLDETLEHSRATLAGLTPFDLELQRTVPGDDRQVTVAWALFHALEHTALHLGQMQLTRQLWDQRQS